VRSLKKLTPLASLSFLSSLNAPNSTLNLVGPIFFAAQLLANLVVFWIVLGLEAFSREMQIGTYVIVVAVVLLIVNGPGSQDYGDTTFQELITEFYALIWACLLTGAMLVTGVLMTMFDLHKTSWWFKYSVLLTARATGFSLNLSTGKAMVLPSNTFWLTTNIIIKVVSGLIYTRAIVIQSTAVEQKVFVPINAATIVLINALTGIIIWEDWRVVTSWVGYTCVFLLLALGCGLLLGDLALLQESSPETFMGARMSMVYRENRLEMLDRLKHFGKELEVLYEESDDNEQALEDPQSQSPDSNTPSFRRNTTAGVVIPHHHHHGHRRSQSDGMAFHRPSNSPRPGLERRRSSILGFGPPRKHQTAWMSVYQGAGATHNQRRSSTRDSHNGLLTLSEAASLARDMAKDMLHDDDSNSDELPTAADGSANNTAKSPPNGTGGVGWKTEQSNLESLAEIDYEHENDNDNDDDIEGLPAPSNSSTEAPLPLPVDNVVNNISEDDSEDLVVHC
jgi:hypothetical protein